jgi:hypothetical protein
MNQRLMLYRKVSAAWREERSIRCSKRRRSIRTTSDSVLNLADYGRIRVMADLLGIDAIDQVAAPSS